VINKSRAKLFSDPPKGKATKRKSPELRQKHLRSKGSVAALIESQSAESTPRKREQKTTKAASKNDSLLKKKSSETKPGKAVTSRLSESPIRKRQAVVEPVRTGSKAKKASESHKRKIESPKTKVESPKTKIESPKTKIAKPTAKVLPKSIQPKTALSPKKTLVVGEIKSAKQDGRIAIETEAFDFKRPSLRQTTWSMDIKRGQSKERIESSRRDLKRKRSDDDDEDEVTNLSPRKRLTTDSKVRRTTISTTAVTTANETISYATPSSREDLKSISNKLYDSERRKRLQFTDDAAEVEGDEVETRAAAGEHKAESDFLTPNKWEMSGRQSRLFDKLWKSSGVQISSDQDKNVSLLSDIAESNGARQNSVGVGGQHSAFTSILTYTGEPVASDHKLESVSVRRSSRQRSAQTRYTEVKQRQESKKTEEVSGAAARLLGGVEVLPAVRPKHVRPWVNRRRFFKFVLVLAIVLLVLLMIGLVVSYLYV